MVSFSSVSAIVAKTYEVSELTVNNAVVVFLVGFILMNFASVKAIEAGNKHGQGLFWTVSFYNNIHPKTFKI